MAGDGAVGPPTGIMLNDMLMSSRLRRSHKLSPSFSMRILSRTSSLWDALSVIVGLVSETFRRRGPVVP
jgi:hypothetical protein